ncbi:MAG TPA: HAMP domain-containing methyl-accepting chemotaxis protein, partial [Acidobacteriota bacterium]|nr:HAMP domain-containing methyl-accepting chemotaxis protein [Acidobacteriota bacterium]
SIDSINRDITVAIQYSPQEWEAQLSSPLKNLNSLTSSYLKTLDTRIIKAQTIDIPPQELFGEGTKTLEAYFQLYDATLKSINTDMMNHYVEWRRDRQIAIGVIILGFGLALLLAGFITRSITNQVNEMTSLFGQIGIGNFEARAAILSEDELGQTSTNLNAMLDNVLTLIQSQEEREQIQHSIMKLLDEISGVAEGDLTQEAEVTAEMTGAIADSFNFMIGELRRIISNVQEVTVNVSAAATEVQSTTEHLAEGSEAQAVQIVDTSAAIEEMAASIQQVSENAVLSATVSEQARVNAKQGSEAVQKTIYGMNGIRQQVQETAKRIKRLGESSQEIGEIVQLISDIADRTSILALNASIQAAMAGEAGRGFAVVAGEVERLAERSAEATKRISTLIKTIQSETNEAVAAMETTTREVVVGSEVANEAGKSLVEIETVSNRLAELMQSISMATKQQARGSESVAKAMGDISDIPQQTAAGTKQAAVSIRKLSELADNLRVSVSTFKLPSNGHGSTY